LNELRLARIFYQAQDIFDKRHKIPADKMSQADEADMRTAINRAYYAAFHKAKVKRKTLCFFQCLLVKTGYNV
jgi:hypothetical protein